MEYCLISGIRHRVGVPIEERKMEEHTGLKSGIFGLAQLTPVPVLWGPEQKGTIAGKQRQRPWHSEQRTVLVLERS